MNDIKELIQVDIDNVAQWFYSVNSQEEYDIAKDFPCIAVPWPMSRWKWAFPKIVNSNGNIKTHRIPTVEYEAIVFDVPSDNQAVFDNLPMQFLKWANPGMTSMSHGEYTNSSGYKYIVSELEEHEVAHTVCCTVHMVKPSRIPIGTYSIFLDYFGVPIGYPWVSPSEHTQNLAGDNANDCSILYPLFYAISLLHCKNIELTEKKYSRQAIRQAKRKGKDLIKYKVLDIEPFKKQVRSEIAGTNESETHRALHICRGHFATYTEDKPLFGKVTGTFWKSMHVRGNKEYGEVRKSYKVKVD